MIGIIIIVLGVLVAVTPWYIFPVCEEGGLYAKTVSGNQLVMPCGYTARAETGVAAPLMVIAGVTFPFSKTKETRIALSLFSVGLGALVLLLPTYIIGMCANPGHPCRFGTLPALVLLGAATITVSVTALVKR